MLIGFGDLDFGAGPSGFFWCWSCSQSSSYKQRGINLGIEIAAHEACSTPKHYGCGQCSRLKTNFRNIQGDILIVMFRSNSHSFVIMDTWVT